MACFQLSHYVLLELVCGSEQLPVYTVTSTMHTRMYKYAMLVSGIVIIFHCTNV